MTTKDDKDIDLKQARMLAIDTLSLAMGEYRDMSSDERKKHLGEIAAVGRVLWDLAMTEDVEQATKDAIRERAVEQFAKFYGL